MIYKNPSTERSRTVAGLDWPRDGRHLFVGGKWTEVKGAEPIPAISPIDEEIIGQVAAAQPEDIDDAVEAISPALADWDALGPNGRVPYLRTLAQEITANAEELAGLETLDGGLTAKTATDNVRTAANSLGFYASYANAITGQTYSTAKGTAAYTVREPYGIAARIFPFNHPLQFAVQNAAPVLLAGNAVIIKAPEQASLSCLALAEIARAVFPPGVFNLVTGYGHQAGAGIVAHPVIRRIGFTGSVPTGRRILADAAAHIKHVTLELGGKNPLVIAGSADRELAVTAAFRGMNFGHAGQSCQSTSRVLIHSSLYDDVVEGLADRMGKIVIGDPRDPATQTGPLAFKAHLDRVLGYIRLGQEEGARLVAGGRRPAAPGKGYYLQPTLFAEVTPEMRIATEEIFGPVVVAIRYTTQAEAVRIANDVEYGLTSRVIAGSLDEAAAIGRQIQAGTTLLNTTGARPRGMPFGGYKESGLGKQACLEEVLSYTQEKSVVAAV